MKNENLHGNLLHPLHHNTSSTDELLLVSSEVMTVLRLDNNIFDIMQTTAFTWSPITCEVKDLIPGSERIPITTTLLRHE